MQLVLSQRFQKDLQKLQRKNPKIEDKVKKTLHLLQQNLQYPSLRLHKLAGFNNWSVSVDMDIRIIMHKERDAFYLLRLGSHEEVY